MARKETLRVSSSDPANESGTEEFPLSDLDHIISKIYVPVTLVYKLEDHVDRQQVIEKLRSSLQVTLSQYPCLRGSLRNDESSNRLFIRKEESNTVPFNIHWLDEHEDDFPSYEMLEKKEFPRLCWTSARCSPRLFFKSRFGASQPKAMTTTTKFWLCRQTSSGVA